MNLKKLCEYVAVSGYEKNLAECLLNELSGVMDKVFIDNVNNLICNNNSSNENKKLLVVAHMDEVGFQVMSKLNEGMYKFKTLGNIKINDLVNQEIVSEKGIIGVIKTEKDVNKDTIKINDLYIETEKESKISIGEVFTFSTTFHDDGETVCCKSLDNRVGCSIIFDLIKSKLNCKYDIYYAFSTQEEIGMRGAKAIISEINPDIIIVVDVSPECESSNIICGKGVGIKLSDGIGVSNSELVDRFVEIANACEIKYQLEVSRYGATETSILSEIYLASKNISISIPCKNMHSSKTSIVKKDINATRCLLEKFIEE